MAVPGTSPVNYGTTGGKGRATRQQVSLADLGGKPTGQSFADRKNAGRKELAVWVDSDTNDKLVQLVKLMGVKYPKDAIVRAISEAYDRYA
jgi:hypothetical protein